jgi:hypothetical protein
MIFVDLADLPRGVRDPPSVPDFRSRCGAPYPGADVTRSDLECPSTLATDQLRPARSDRVDHGRGIDRVRLSARVASRRIFRPPAWDRPAWTRHQMAPINPRTSMPHSKRTRRTMMDSNTLQRNAHPVRHEAATHLFAIGQIVRLKGGFGLQSQSADTYRITATLPPQGDSQQYRIRNDDEHYERVARQDSLEPARILPVGPSGALIEGTFGAGQAIETQQLRDQKSRSRRRPSPSLKAQELG